MLPGSVYSWVTVRRAGLRRAVACGPNRPPTKGACHRTCSLTAFKAAAAPRVSVQASMHCSKVVQADFKAGFIELLHQQNQAQKGTRTSLLVYPGLHPSKQQHASGCFCMQPVA